MSHSQLLSHGPHISGGGDGGGVAGGGVDGGAGGDGGDGGRGGDEGGSGGVQHPQVPRHSVAIIELTLGSQVQPLKPTRKAQPPPMTLPVSVHGSAGGAGGAAGGSCGGIGGDEGGQHAHVPRQLSPMMDEVSQVHAAESLKPWHPAPTIKPVSSHKSKGMLGGVGGAGGNDGDGGRAQQPQ